MKDFYFFNPDINANCTNLLLGLAYCVQAVGNIATYSGIPTTSQYTTFTLISYSTLTAITTADEVRPTLPRESQLPTASRNLSNCDSCRNFVAVRGIVDQSESPDISTTIAFVNSCIYIAGAYHVAISDLMSWNPSLSADNCALQPGFSYCVVQTAPDSTGE